MNGKKIIKKYKETKRSSLLTYFVLRILVIVCIVLQFLAGNYDNMFLAMFSLLLFTIPTLIKDKFEIEIPSVLEGIIYLFIFASEILGEINNFYGIIPFWDTLLHTLNGFLCAGVGLSLVDLLNRNSSKLNLSPLYLVIVAFCFSMTVGVCWEFFEYGADTFFGTDMQKDWIISDINSVELNPVNENVAYRIPNIATTTITTTDGQEYEIQGYLDIGLIDTMKDLIVNFIGAVVFSIFGFYYIKTRDEGNFIKHFLVTKKKKEIVRN